MYALNDFPAAIREIQRFLHIISDRIEPRIPRVAIDGIYGTETQEAVRVFQIIYGLIPSGYVDRSTFDGLFEVYSGVLKNIKARDYFLTNEGFPLKLGSIGNDVIALHLLIEELGKIYKDINYVGKGSYFSENTRSAIMNLQIIFKYSVTGEVDALFLERMIYEVDAIRRLERVYE